MSGDEYKPNWTEEGVFNKNIRLFLWLVVLMAPFSNYMYDCVACAECRVWTLI